MKLTTSLVLSVVLIVAGTPAVPALHHQLQETTAVAAAVSSGDAHQLRRLQQPGSNTAGTTVASLDPAGLATSEPATALPAVQQPSLMSTQIQGPAPAAAAADGGPQSRANSSALAAISSANSRTNSSTTSSSPQSPPGDQVVPVSEPALAESAPSTASSPANSTATAAAVTPVATQAAAVPILTGSSPLAAVNQSSSQQDVPQPNTPAAVAAPNMSAATGATAAAATSATAAAAEGLGGIVGTSAAAQWAWSAGSQPGGGDGAVVVLPQPITNVQEKAEVDAAAVPAPAERPQQSAWNAGWGDHPDDNDLLLSSDNDHQTQPPLPQQGSVEITVLHFNDWHVRVEATKESYCALCTPWDVDQGRCSGGLARMSTFIKQQRRLDPDLLLLNAGDDFIGTEWDRKSGMDAPAAFMNLLAPDAMTIGNHEWDKGLDTLEQYLGKLNATKEAVLGANIDFGGHDLQHKVQRYVIKEVKGRKVCIFGLTTQYALPGNAKMWPVCIREPYSVGREVLEDLQQQGCHATILLSHLGYTSDLVAAKVLPGLDLVIGGHSHSFLWPNQYDPPAYYMDGSDCKRDETWGPYPTYVHSNGRDVPVVQASWASRYMGRLVLRFDPESAGGKCNSVQGQVFMMGGPNSEYHVEEDQQALDEIQNYRSW